MEGISGHHWEMGAMKDVTMKRFWTWDKTDSSDGLGDMYLGRDWCSKFEKEILFELDKTMWRKHQSTFQYQNKYMHNDIVKPFSVGILH